MGTVRATLRACALFSAILAIYLLWLAGKFLLAPFVATKRRWRKLIFHICGKSVAKIIGMRLHLSGDPPQPPFFLVSNHLSYVDIVALAAHLNCVFVAKSEVAAWPLIGPIAASIGTIFIKRRTPQDLPRAIGLLNRALDEELGVVVFPEGTSTMGESVLPFKPGLLDLAAKAGDPVSYAALSYSTPPDEPPAHLSVCWWGEMEFLPHLWELLKLSHFDAFLTFGTHAIHSDDRKTLAQALWQAVNEQFIPVVTTSSGKQKKEI